MMTIYLALLRGINVGGHNKIKMADLKRMLEEIGFHRVQTYIQSGNVLFESEEEADAVQRKMESEILATFGCSITVMIRTAAEFHQLMAECPFDPELLSEGDSIHINLLHKAPTQAEIDNLPEVAEEQDEYHLAGREVYWLLRQSILDSKLPKKFQKLGPMTSRNWKTMKKLHTLALAMED